MIEGEFTEMIMGALKHVRVSEQLRACIRTIQPLNDALADVLALDTDLSPEIGVAADALEELLLALSRAGNFADARYEAMVERLGQ